VNISFILYRIEEIEIMNSNKCTGGIEMFIHNKRVHRIAIRYKPWNKKREIKAYNLRLCTMNENIIHTYISSSLSTYCSTYLYNNGVKK